VFTNNFDRIEFEPCELKHEGHFGCLDEMFEALIAGRKAETDCSDNIKSMQMVFGALESAKTGKKVMLLD
jgi:CO dehydrogenase/acetyl-CoA synthase alpha subunit